MPSATKQALIFTKQMSSLYNKSSWKDKDIVLEFYYTDIDEKYQIIMKKALGYERTGNQGYSGGKTHCLSGHKNGF